MVNTSFQKEDWLAINFQGECFFRGVRRFCIEELMCEDLGNSRAGRRLALEASRCAGLSQQEFEFENSALWSFCNIREKQTCQILKTEVT